MMHVMIDLETLSTDSNAAIVAIGAVYFDADTIIETFYTNVDLKSSMDSGGVVDGDTVMWWMQQNAAARQAAFVKGSMTLAAAIAGFAHWLREVSSDEPDQRVIWGNGAAFDNVILANAYKRLGLVMPWSYKNDMCFRTMRALHPRVEVDFEGLAHHALEDAKWQALYLMKLGVL